MVLTLEATGTQAAQLGSGSRKVFGPEGGLIGRDKHCAWVLPHSKVSSRHAIVSYQSGVFYIEDTSTNGVFLNSSRTRLVKGRPYALKSGDSILIDPYVIQVTVSSESQVPAGRRPSPIPAPRAVSPFDESDPFNLDDPFGEGRAGPVGMSPGLDPHADVAREHEVDPLKLLDPSPKLAPPRNAPKAQDLELSSPLRAHYQPPDVVTPTPSPGPLAPADPFMIPADYDPLGPDEPPDPRRVAPSFSTPPAPTPVPPERSEKPREAPVPVFEDFDEPIAAPAPTLTEPELTASEAIHSSLLDPIPSAAPPATPTTLPPIEPAPESRSVETPPSSGEAVLPPSGPSARPVGPNVDLRSVLSGAGLDPEDVTPELARNFGEILRVVVAGVMEVLRARQQIKDEFRMRMTQFRAADNNPLKFSANVDDALHNLLVKRNAAYLNAVDAFQDAFDDLRNHQVAMLAGMRTAFESMLAEFDADRLQEQFDRQLKRGGLLGVPAKLRYWDLYRDFREELVKDPEEAFRKLFGEEFAKEYEAQLQRLKKRHK